MEKILETTINLFFFAQLLFSPAKGRMHVRAEACPSIQIQLSITAQARANLSQPHPDAEMQDIGYTLSPLKSPQVLGFSVLS